MGTTNTQMRKIYVTADKLRETIQEHDRQIGQVFSERMAAFAQEWSDRITAQLIENSAVVKRQTWYGTLVCAALSAVALAVAIVALVLAATGP